MNKQTQKDVDYLEFILCPYGKKVISKIKKYKSLEDYIAKNTDKAIEFLEAVEDVVIKLPYFSIYLPEDNKVPIDYFLDRFYGPRDNSEFTLTKKEIKTIIRRFKYIVKVIKNFEKFTLTTFGKTLKQMKYEKSY